MVSRLLRSLKMSLTSKIFSHWRTLPHCHVACVQARLTHLLLAAKRLTIIDLICVLADPQLAWDALRISWMMLSTNLDHLRHIKWGRDWPIINLTIKLLGCLWWRWDRQVFRLVELSALIYDNAGDNHFRENIAFRYSICGSSISFCRIALHLLSWSQSGVDSLLCALNSNLKFIIFRLLCCFNLVCLLIEVLDEGWAQITIQCDNEVMWLWILLLLNLNQLLHETVLVWHLLESSICKLTPLWLFYTLTLYNSCERLLESG